ncbi:MAG: multidrug effflux MFS transporter [Verrucomicrobia bacterium]|nr:multidrug effflux MFS transporter [Verrucomicrobiota bacterium]
METLLRAERRKSFRKIDPQSKSFIVLLAATVTLPSLSIDSCLTSLPTIGLALRASPVATALILSLFMAGFAGGQLFFGPLCDRIGRRPALLLGCGVFTLSALGCTLSPTIATLAFWRFVQGFGAAAGAVIVFAIIRDLFSGAASRTRLSYISVVATIAPIVAPSLGGLIAIWLGWRAVFFSLAVAGGILAFVIGLSLKESIPTVDRDALQVGALVSNYWKILSHRSCLTYSLLGGLSFGTLFAYVTGSAFVFIEFFHVSQRGYGILFAVNAVGIAIGAFLSGRLNSRGVSSRLLIVIGLFLAMATSGFMLTMELSGVLTALSVMPMLFLITFTVGLIMPNIVHGVLEPMSQIAGVASSVFGSIRMFGGALSSELVACLYTGTPMAMVITMTLFSSAAMLVGAIFFSPRLLARYRVRVTAM